MVDTSSSVVNGFQQEICRTIAFGSQKQRAERAATSTAHEVRCQAQVDCL